jgi:hypothetical protein
MAAIHIIIEMVEQLLFSTQGKVNFIENFRKSEMPVSL